MRGATRTEVTRDPVCGAIVVPTHSDLVSEYQGRKYHFCCSGCKNSFGRDPALLLRGYSVRPVHMTHEGPFREE